MMSREQTQEQTQAIRHQLERLSAKQGIRILHACESGSRAWGFASPDSDYDVRLIYARPLTWYLRVQKEKDVISDLLEGDLDLGGWDVRKCLGLLKKSNGPLLEWLGSPIVYAQDIHALEPLCDLVEPGFQARAACHHYLALAGRKRDTVLEQDHASRPKDYLYALRATFCARYICDHRRPPPVPFIELLALYLPGGQVRVVLDDLLAKKGRSGEGETTALAPELRQLLTEELDVLETRIPENGPLLPPARFNEAFLEILRRLGQLPEVPAVFS